jgi:hypothetical protein
MRVTGFQTSDGGVGLSEPAEYYGPARMPLPAFPKAWAVRIYQGQLLAHAVGLSEYERSLRPVKR